LVFKKDINSFTPLDQNKFPAKYLLGIFASKFISYLHIKSSSSNDLIQTTPTELRSLPIPNVSINEQSTIISLVNIVLPDINVRYTDTTQQIDQLVYQLYNLTREEIQIVKRTIK
jgi:biotin synthase-like enzyme